MAAPQPPPQGQLPRYPYAQPSVPNGIASTLGPSQQRPYQPYIPTGLPPLPPQTQSTPRGQPMPPWSNRPLIPGQTSAFYPVQQATAGNPPTSRLGPGSTAPLATMNNPSLGKSPLGQSSPNLVPLVNGNSSSNEAPNLPRPSSFAGPMTKDSNLLLPPGYPGPSGTVSVGATPNSSAPPSNRTSRNVSPAPSSKYDNMEGQFPPSAATSPLGSSSNLNGMVDRASQLSPLPPTKLNQPPNARTQPPLPNPPGPPLAPFQSPFRTPIPAPNAYYPASPPTQPPQQQQPPHAPYWNNPASASNAPNSPAVVSQPGLMQTQTPTPNNYATQYRPTGTMPPQIPSNTTPYLPQIPQIPGNRYPQPPTNYGPALGQKSSVDQLTPAFNAMGVQQTVQQGFNALWGTDNLDLLQTRNVLPPDGVKAPSIRLQHEYMNGINCSPDIFRCTLTKIPETNTLLQKSRLPLGVLIHPFKDLNQLPVIQCQNIVRCRSCRTYINPFVYFVDQRRWKCNLCFRVNELPDEFQFDPMTKTYGDPSRRPEVKNATIEFIAPSEYMLRPPQPAIYLFVLDVSHNAVETGYLKVFCDTLIEELDKVPGDTRTQIGFITFDTTIHFYNLAEGRSQPHQMVVTDIDDIFLPCPSDLLVHMNTSKQLVLDFLEELPTRFLQTPESNSALGAALQAAYKLVSPIGGRITVMQSTLPMIGPAALKPREDPNQRAAKDVSHLNPAIDFYKKLALDCSGQQVAVDLFLFGSQYVDIATLSCAAKFSGGSIYHFPGFHYIQNVVQAERFERCLRRYLTRKVGFEAVMRIRCTRGLTIHTFHGNFFVRSTDLLSLPNVNPDSGFGMQVSIEENLADVQNVCFQAALLYTSSKGERRIRVHTMCLPLASTVADIIQSADQQCIVGLLAKMAVDRSLQSSISDARDAFINVCIDALSAYKASQTIGSAGLIAPPNLRLLPLYVLALLKSVAFRSGTSTRLDDRVYAMCQMKTLPLAALIQAIYPDLYPVHNLTDQGAISVDDVVVPQPPRLQLSAEKVDTTGCYLMDTGDILYIYVGKAVGTTFCQAVLGSASYQALPEQMLELPEVETPESERLRSFVNYLQNQKPYPAVLQLIKEDSKQRGLFIERLTEDRNESALSYYEFLQHLKTSVK